MNEEYKKCLKYFDLICKEEKSKTFQTFIKKVSNEDLILLTQHSSVCFRALAIKCCAERDSEEIKETIIKTAKDKNDYVRKTVISLFNQKWDEKNRKKAKEILISSTKDKDCEVKEEAFWKIEDWFNEKIFSINEIGFIVEDKTTNDGLRRMAKKHLENKISSAYILDPKQRISIKKLYQLKKSRCNYIRCLAEKEFKTREKFDLNEEIKKEIEIIEDYYTKEGKNNGNEK